MKFNKNHISVKILLLSAVVGLWGYVIFRFISAGEEPEVGSIAKPVITDKHYQSSDSTTLMANYRDPFLDHVAIAYEEEMPEESEGPVVPPAPKEIIVWPEIGYEGQIKNKKKKLVLALVSISGNSLLMNLGDKKEGVKLDKLYPDSARFQYKGEYKTIYTSRIK